MAASAWSYVWCVHIVLVNSVWHGHEILTSTRLQQYPVGTRWLSAGLLYILTAMMTGYDILQAVIKFCKRHLRTVELVFLLLHLLCLQQLVLY